jgi:hypothetical protein
MGARDFFIFSLIESISESYYCTGSQKKIKSINLQVNKNGALLSFGIKMQ